MKKLITYTYQIQYQRKEKENQIKIKFDIDNSIFILHLTRTIQVVINYSNSTLISKSSECKLIRKVIKDYHQKVLNETVNGIKIKEIKELKNG